MDSKKDFLSRYSYKNIFKKYEFCAENDQISIKINKKYFHIPYKDIHDITYKSNIRYIFLIFLVVYLIMSILSTPLFGSLPILFGIFLTMIFAYYFRDNYYEIVSKDNDNIDIKVHEKEEAMHFVNIVKNKIILFK